MQRVVAIGDLHCGHATGLTPPGWIANTKGREKIAEVQLRMWDHFSAAIEQLGKIDVCICNGEAIDGKGKRSGGIEQTEPDLERQA